MMATMTSVIWLRRFMIIISLIMVIITVFRLYKHRCKGSFQLIINWTSVILTVAFIGYTIFQFGW